MSEESNTKIIEIDGKKIHLAKGAFKLCSWRVIEPIKNEDGSTNWFNLLTGGKSNLVKVGFYVLIALLIYMGLKETMNSCEVLQQAYDLCCYDVTKQVTLFRG